MGAEDALLNALLIAAKRFSSGPPQLLTQICLALSALMLHAVEHSKPIEQLFYSLQNLQTQDDGNIAVLEMLTVLPEVIEDQSADCNISSARRGEYGRELLSRTPMVLDFLLQQYEKSLDGGIRLHERNRKILRCLLSWVALSFDLAIEVLVELVSQYEGVPQVLLCRIGYLKEVLLLPALTNGDEKVIGGLACLMSEIGQAAPSLIVEASSEALAMADALLSCVAYPSGDWEIADSTLQFWISLASYILGLDVDSWRKRKHVEDMFFSVFSALLDSLLLRAQVDNSTINDDTGALDLPDGLAQFRMNLVELLVDICQLLRSATFIQKIFFGGWMTSNEEISWKEVETKMFALNVVAEVVLQEGQTFDFSVIMHLVTILSSRASNELKGFVCIDQLQMLLVPIPSGYLPSKPMPDPYCSQNFLIICTNPTFSGIHLIWCFQINHGRIKVSSALAAEAWAVRIAVAMAVAWGKKEAIIESDCKVLVDLLQPDHANTNWTIQAIIDDIVSLSVNANFVFSWCNRKVNSCAHWIASNSRIGLLSFISPCNIPSKLCSLIRMDF
ncbi:hypothetical protein RHGRI_023196 [Rhododendron griersonianum]|uniref:RNase H type-1 domain-containing protein n=1 Tax=Rhododendron griersonianum TaxID=479676 RepID=A0AAV6J602_9ERIC|nr:hypothetical protein RHGRI_023196 [Rhododendron griersonianum]